MAADLTWVVNRREAGRAIRRQHEGQWLAIEQLCCPRRSGTLLGANAGATLTAGQYTAAGELAARDLVAALMGNLTNMSTRWLSFVMQQDELNAVNAVQNYCEALQSRYLRALAASNFVYQWGEWFTDLVTIGTAAMLQFVRPAPPGQWAGYIYQTLAPGAFVLFRNAEGIADSIIYETQMSIRAAAHEWGLESLPKVWRERFPTKPDDQVTVARAIYPRTDRDPRRLDNRHMAWADVLFATDGEPHLIKEGGFKRFPAVIGAWSLASGEDYGRGPGHQAIGDMQTLNEMKRLKLTGAALDLWPETYEVEDTVIGGIIREPGARNIVRSGHDVRTAVTTMTSGARFDIGQLVESEVLAIINRCFLSDMIRALPPVEQGNTYFTAYEVSKRYEQAYRLLGPTFGQITGQHEGIGHLVYLGINALGDAGVLPPPPPEIPADANLDVQYEGPLAKAQQAGDLQSIETQVAWAMSVDAANPDPVNRVADNYDIDALAQHMGRVRGVPARGMRGTDAVQALRDRRSQAMAQTQQQQEALALTQGAKNMAPMMKAMQPQGGGA